MTTTPAEEPTPSEKVDENTPTGELGQHMHKGPLNLMWAGAFVAVGDAEFLTENGRIIKIISFTPREFRE